MAKAKKQELSDEPGVETPAAPQEVTLPETIKLLAPHGFIDEDGEHKYWNQNQVVTDQEHIKLLMDRGADWE